MAHRGPHTRSGRGLTARASALLGAVALILGLAACEPSPNTYVALGDSYTAGPIIPVQSTDPAGCLRSDHNYPHLLFPSTGLARLRDVSCSGATTDDMFTFQEVTPGPANVPQLSVLDEHTRAVTLTIGGNDIGFVSIIEDCVRLPTQAPCRDDFVTTAGDEISQRIVAAKRKVQRVVESIHIRAPQAEVLVVGYPSVLPDTGAGCYPKEPFLAADVAYLRAKTTELNRMLRTVAGNNDAGFVDTYTPSIGHDICSLPTVRWIEGLVPVAAAAPVHPNAAGMQGLATIVGKAVRAAIR